MCQILKENIFFNCTTRNATKNIAQNTWNCVLLQIEFHVCILPPSIFTVNCDVYSKTKTEMEYVNLYIMEPAQRHCEEHTQYIQMLELVQKDTFWCNFVVRCGECIVIGNMKAIYSPAVWQTDLLFACAS